MYRSGELPPEDWLRFVHMPGFERNWKRLNLNDSHLRLLETSIMVNPKSAPVMKGTGGLRKIRFALLESTAGKSGSIRVCYVYFERYSIVALMAAYGKNERSALSRAETKEIALLIKEIEGLLNRGGIR